MWETSCERGLAGALAPQQDTWQIAVDCAGWLDIFIYLQFLRLGLIEIFHFPIRSYSQFENKIAKGGAAYENNQELARNIGGTWRKLYEEYQQNNNLLSYYQESLYDQKKLQEQLESGSILIDKRLSKYFTEKGLTWCHKRNKCNLHEIISRRYHTYNQYFSLLKLSIMRRIDNNSTAINTIGTFC